MWLLALPIAQLATTALVLFDDDNRWLRLHWTAGALVTVAVAIVNAAAAWQDRRDVVAERRNGLLLLWTTAALMGATIALGVPALMVAAGAFSLAGGQARWALASLLGVNLLAMTGAIHQMIARHKMRAYRAPEPQPPPGGWRRRATDRMELDDKNRLDSPWRPDEPPMT